MTKSAAFHPSNSSAITDDTFADFIRAPVTGELRDIPGIGPKSVEKLGEGEEPVGNTYQLIGKYLSLKANDVETKEHCDRFYAWLAQKGINSHRAAVVLAIAQKCEVMFPGTFDETVYQEEGDEEEEG